MQHGGAAGFADLGHHAVGSRGVGAFTVGAAAQVVDHHLGAACGQCQSVLFAQATACARDNGDASCEIHAHGLSLCVGLRKKKQLR